jgi:parvulin-like peptidyl-prolyl cis-trans isomerase-like protein
VDAAFNVFAAAVARRAVRRLAKLAVAATIAAPGFNEAVSEQDVAHWKRAAGGDAQALSFLIEAAWGEGEARERGIVVGDTEAEQAVDERPRDGLKRGDLVYRARVALLTARIRDQIAQPAAQGVTPEQIEAYVRRHPRVEPERRRTRLVIAADRAKARAAFKALQSNVTWRSTARRYGGSGAPRTIKAGVLPKHVERAVFSAREKTLVRYGAYVFEVVQIIPGGPTPLEQQRATAWEILSSQAQVNAIGAFTAELRSRWRLRTTCAAVYANHPDCGNPPTVE